MEKAKKDHLIFRDQETLQSKYYIEESLLKDIKLPNHVKKHLKYLLKAILEVNYWKYVTPGSDVQKNGDKAIFKSFTERAFAYELYHQWRKVLETENEEDLILNGELSKKVSIFDGIYHKSKSHSEYLFPDLILHAPHNHNEKSQLFVCEIKKDTVLNRLNVIKDLCKLCFFTTCDGDYEFAYGIFILVGKKLTEKLGRKDIRNIKEKLCDYGHPFEKIICISYYNDNGNKTLEIEFLSNLLKTDNKKYHEIPLSHS